MKTIFANEQTVTHKWYVVDGAGIELGRLASQVAAVLRGKHKPTFTPNVDCGDHVIVINSDAVAVTGKKLDQKMHRYHTMWPSGLKETPYRKFMSDKSDDAVYIAVKGMLPKNSLGRQMLRKLRVYKNADHGHVAQKPEVLELVRR